MLKLFCALLLVGCESNKPIEEKSFLPCEYSVFWEAVKLAESGGNRFEVYHEKLGDKWCPYHNKIGIDSLGLYQVSFEDGVRYNCPFMKRDDAFNPDLNTICKDLIEDRLKSKYPNGTWSQALGMYWSSLRRAEDWGYDYPGYIRFKKYAADLGCMIP